MRTVCDATEGKKRREKDNMKRKFFPNGKAEKTSRMYYHTLGVLLQLACQKYLYLGRIYNIVLTDNLYSISSRHLLSSNVSEYICALKDSRKESIFVAITFTGSSFFVYNYICLFYTFVTLFHTKQCVFQ